MSVRFARRGLYNIWLVVVVAISPRVVRHVRKLRRRAAHISHIFGRICVGVRVGVIVGVVTVGGCVALAAVVATGRVLPGVRLLAATFGGAF